MVHARQSGYAGDPSQQFPPRPVFGDYSAALWFQIPQEAKEIIVGDDLAVKQYIRRTEERVKIHNGEVE